MNNKSHPYTNTQPIAGSIISCLFGAVVVLSGLINTFWGNDTGFGIFLLLLSLIYFPAAENIFKRMTGVSVPWFVKVLLACFIIWVVLGVGELFDKIGMMIRDVA